MLKHNIADESSFISNGKNEFIEKSQTMEKEKDSLTKALGTNRGIIYVCQITGCKKKFTEEPQLSRHIGVFHTGSARGLARIPSRA